MTRWGLVATVKAPEDQVLAFVAHHLALGAERLWIYFDDPADPAYARVARLPRVTATRCTDWYWLKQGGRPSRHPVRQIRNAGKALRGCRLEWLGHIDVDEFLHAPRPVADLLAEVPPDVPSLLLEPFEALHDPGLADDIFTARDFRGPLGEGFRHLQAAIFGPAAPMLQKGALGHVLGKGFCRPKLRGIRLTLHGVQLNGATLAVPFHPDLRVLHFHAQDPAAWREALPYRLAHGAYHYPEEAPLKAGLLGADDGAIAAFYRAAMTLTPEKAAILEQHGRLITADLGLRAKVARLLAGQA
jgi:hypothetical protein